MPEQRVPIHGQLQCPVEFYDFCVDNFKSINTKIENEIGSLSEELGEVKSDLRALKVKHQERETLQSRLIEHCKWIVGTIIAISSAIIAYKAISPPQPVQKVNVVSEKVELKNVN